MEQDMVTPGLRNSGDDTWIHSACDMCFAACGIIAHKQDGVLVKIDGDPNCPASEGNLCANGQAGLIGLYDPSRVKTPLKRTNPKKGLGVDPQWQEITWAEALDILTEKLTKVRREDPRKLVITSFDQIALSYFIRPAWGVAFGTPNTDWVGYYCGNYLHASMYLTNGSFHSDFDLDYCNYAILLGNQQGFMAGLNANVAARKMAEARKRGMRVVVVDPVGTNAAAKADEWVPIRPGTDGAFILSLIHVLVNEIGCYDREFLSFRSNGAYLVGEDGHYLRETASSKPLVWNRRTGKAVPFDQEGIDPALEGVFEVQGHKCQPAFQLLKKQVRAYDPEKVAEITTIPAGTIRRIAKEFGEAARIGSTIVLDGKTLPYRPVAVNIYRGAGAHKHGTHTALAVQTLNMVVGAFYVPGGHRGVNLVGPNGRWSPGATKEGLITPPSEIGRAARYYDFEARPPEDMGLHELFPLTTNRSPLYQLNASQESPFKLPYTPEVLIVCRRNLMMNNVSAQSGAEMLMKIPFVVTFSVHLDEVAEFADLVLPEAHYLERFDLFPNRPSHTMSPATGHFYWGLRQPVIEPLGQARRWIDVLYEVADRMGFLGDVYRLMNVNLGIKGPYKLNPSERYSMEEIYDRWTKSLFGPERGISWFKENGYHKVPRAVEERYPGPFLRARFPIYYENMLEARKSVEKLSEQIHLKWDTSDYVPLANWKPCPAFSDGTKEYDLYVVNYKLPFHSLSITTQNPWLNEMAESHPYAYRIMINAETAKRKEILDGQEICVESVAGKVKGRAKVTQCIHPEVLGIAGVFGSWAKGKPVANGKGVHFNNLLPISVERLDPVSAGVDSCIRVRVTKA
ncbi:MAG: molybdopterin-dependent oxidoreductase [Candidatus Tectomicrobia bacterium]|uniref:Molybdopterin-dependent oxidoreductase n=1 Tax=Tectimicrobiota bacterium TaxID=2528274 RepID=A0A932GQY7_UNCTE|nr:molybdopterin-dependent oxidoreductase [Candidatus Tectomicrobia bacterium]